MKNKKFRIIGALIPVIFLSLVMKEPLGFNYVLWAGIGFLVGFILEGQFKSKKKSSYGISRGRRWII